MSLWPRLTAFWAAWALLVGVLLNRLLLDALLLRQPACDTTYLWQGYEEVPVGGGLSYRLVKFVDGDSDTVAARTRLLRQRDGRIQEVPVLFVHGHLGSHQQMRSAASETGRELARRAAADPASWPLWLHWYAADFNAEASALDGALLSEQADFVLRCVSHLRQLHASTGGTQRAAGVGQGPKQQRQAFRLVLVAYSMGGLVARQAVRSLASDPSFDMSQLVVLVTLASPPHFPAFMPNTPLAALLNWAWPGNGSYGSGQCNSANLAEAAAAAVPSTNILAGAGDFSLPQTHAGVAGPADSPFADGGLALLMRDMPGVWATCSHKGVVSCNQLIRQLVPALVDATLLSMEGARFASLAQRQAAVQALLHTRLATDAAGALGLAAVGAGDVGASQQAAETEQQEHQQQQGLCTPGAVEDHLGAELVTAPLVRRHVTAGASLSLSWDGRQAAEAGWSGLLLLVTAAPPCTHLSVVARQAGSSGAGGIAESSSLFGVQLAQQAVALPPLLPGLQQRWVPRPWQEVMRGIDWQHNATRLLYLPFANLSSAAGQPVSIEVRARGSGGGGTALLVQALSSSPADTHAVLNLPPPGWSLVVPQGHAALLRLSLPSSAWPMGGGACAARGLLSSRRCLALLLVGPTPPWELSVKAQQCSNPSSSSSSLGAAGCAGNTAERQQHVLPAVLAIRSGSHLGGGDSVRVAAGGDTAIQLWNGMGSLDQLFLITDPLCAYSISLRWAVGGWLGLTLRHLLLMLPALSIAASQARLSPLPGSGARVAAAAAVLTAWGSQYPAALQSATGVSGLQPWVHMSAAEALAALLLAAGVAKALNGVTLAGLGLLRHMLRRWPTSCTRWLARVSAAAAVASSCLAPPAVALALGCCSLAIRLVAAAATHGTHSPSTDPGGDRCAAQLTRSHAWPWLVFYSQLWLLPAVELLSWVLGSGRQVAPWTVGRALVALMSLHACLLPSKDSGSKRAQPQRWRQLLRAAMHEAAACAAAAATAWGYPWWQLPSAGLSLAVDVVLAI